MAQEEACKASYFQGKPWSEAERLSLLRAQVLVDDLFTASVDDFQMMVNDGKHERDKSH
jgi:hypothetical protein